jgi:CheY-like chemotaxis protein/AraC-like DNA-binding protein
MKTLLIVEDEKAIREGVRAMVSRGPVPVDNILTCANGEEAMEILHSRAVEVMITDIRMPKMDGVELVRRARELPSPPVTIVISGFSEFSYAVSVFRDGVRDYILKPIERDNLYALLTTVQAELDAKNGERNARLISRRHILRSVMLSDGSGDEGLAMLSPLFDDHLLSTSYVVICSTGYAFSAETADGSNTNPHPPDAAGKPYFLQPLDDDEAEDCVCFSDNDRQAILLVPAPALTKILQHVPGSLRVGHSGAKQEIGQVREAYAEAVLARKYAFLHGGVWDYGSIPDRYPQEKSPVAASGQIIQLLGAGNTEEAIGLFGQVLLLAQNHRTHIDTFFDFLEQLSSNMKNTFGHIPGGADEALKLEPALAFEGAFEYFTAYSDYIRRLSGYLSDELLNQNILRIRQAVEYIDEHFRSEINMAMASNHVSMNYTQFSLLFNQYTGSSFPDYLKSIRLAESRRLLADPTLSIRRVGELSGFKNEKHFLKSFKREIGVPPGDYRRNLMRKKHTVEGKCGQ